MDLEAEGKEVRALQDMPDLFPDLIQDWEVFWEMSESRPASMEGIAAIPMSEIVSYLELWNIRNLGARITFANRIRTMDRTYRKIKATQKK